MDFSRTRLSLRRSPLDYSRVRAAIGSLVRDRKKFWSDMPAELYLDLGPGENLDETFYNIDYSWSPKIDACVDLEKGIELPTDSVDGIFTEHCLEHISTAGMLRTLRDCRRIMKAGAIMRVIMPDAELHARAYITALDEGHCEVPHATTLERDGVLTPVMSINNVMRNHGHRFIYDKQTFGEYARAAGFETVRAQDFMTGADPRLLRDTAARRDESFYVELS